MFFELSKTTPGTVLSKQLAAYGCKMKVVIKSLASATRLLVAWDRHLFIEDRARQAQIAQDNNDVRGTFGIVRSLAGSKAKHLQFVLQDDGVTKTST